MEVPSNLSPEAQELIDRVESLAIEVTRYLGENPKKAERFIDPSLLEEINSLLGELWYMDEPSDGGLRILRRVKSSGVELRNPFGAAWEEDMMSVLDLKPQKE